MARFKPVRGKSEWFAKDPDQQPFFSIHPKTKVGTILRILLSAFILFSLALTLLARAGLLFLWFYKLYYLVYIVPVFGLAALLLLALWKRMPSPAIKIGVTGILGLLVVSVMLSFASMMAYTSGFGPSPKGLLLAGDNKLVLIRTCDSEPAYVERVTGEDGSITDVNKYLRRMDAYKYSVRVPVQTEGEAYTIEGELYAPENASIKSEWTDAATMRLFIAEDESEAGYGEIFVRFAPSEETMPAMPDASTKQEFLKTVASENRSVSVYREKSFIDHPVDSPLSVQESDMKQLFAVYPCVLRSFARIDRRVEGVITLERQGTLTGFHVETKDDMCIVTPTEDSVGASGEIRVYFHEKAAPAEATPNDATPSDATPSAATPGE